MNSYLLKPKLLKKSEIFRLLTTAYAQGGLIFLAILAISQFNFKQLKDSSTFFAFLGVVWLLYAFLWFFREFFRVLLPLVARLLTRFVATWSISIQSNQVIFCKQRRSGTECFSVSLKSITSIERIHSLDRWENGIGLRISTEGESIPDWASSLIESVQQNTTYEMFFPDDSIGNSRQVEQFQEFLNNVCDIEEFTKQAPDTETKGEIDMTST